MTMDQDSSQIRLSALGIVAIALFLTLFLRLWFLQGIDRQQFEAVSQSNRLRVIHEEAPRGRILDRNGRVIVDNRTSLVVSLDREPLRKMEESERRKIFVRLADALESLGAPVKVDLMEKRFNDRRYSPQDSVPIVDNVSDAVEIYLTERADRFPGVLVERKAIRTYPYGDLAAHILGYVGQINDKELAKWNGTDGEDGRVGPDGTANRSAGSGGNTNRSGGDNPSGGFGYQPGDSIGKSGVEQAYERDLRGAPGQRTIEVNARGDMVDVVKVEPPSQGNDVWLTIDIDLQARAEQVLADRISSLRGGRDKDGNVLHVPQGSVVIQDPMNGQILAMASYPTYDPSSLVNGISQDRWDALNDPSAGSPLINWAIGESYAPGSTFKLFTTYAGLVTGYLTGSDAVIVDRGVYQVENCRSGKCEFQNAGRTAYGQVGISRALTVSSDVYFYRLGDKFWNLRERFGDTPIQDAAELFGLGSRTGFALVGEQPGRIPTPKARREAYEARPDLFMTGDWRSGDNINMAIGQGDVETTPLQLANSYSAFANGGTLYVPQIVSKVTRSKDPTVDVTDPANTELIWTQEPEAVSTIPFTADQWNVIFDGLVGVTQARGGTAREAWLASPTAWPMAGKTGTAQVSNKADTALFVGWGPAEHGVDPRYTIAVVIPQAGFGGSVAAPLAFQVLQPASSGELDHVCPVDDGGACLAAKIAALEALNEREDSVGDPGGDQLGDPGSGRVGDLGGGRLGDPGGGGTGSTTGTVGD